MPHCIIEYSAHLGHISSDELDQLAHLLNQQGAIQPTNLKIRAYPCENTWVDGGESSFAALTLKLLPGRDDAWKSKVGKALLEFLQQTLSADKPSVEIIELNVPHYFKP